MQKNSIERLKQSIIAYIENIKLENSEIAENLNKIYEECCNGFYSFDELYEIINDYFESLPEYIEHIKHSGVLAMDKRESQQNYDLFFENMKTSSVIRFQNNLNQALIEIEENKLKCLGN